MFIQLLAHIRARELLPQQARVSHAVAISKPGKSPTGNSVTDITTCLRLLHCFCHWWRVLLRVGLVDYG
eukprot:521206-Pyramimonas_sp.AAC.1